MEQLGLHSPILVLRSDFTLGIQLATAVPVSGSFRTLLLRPLGLSLGTDLGLQV